MSAVCVLHPALVLDSSAIEYVVADHGQSGFSAAYEATNAYSTGTTLAEIVRAHSGYDVQSHGRCGWTLLAIAITQHCSLEGVRELLRADPSLARKGWGDMGSRSYLGTAATTGHLALVRCLVEEAGAPVNLTNEYGLGTPLAAASHSGHRDVCAYLLLRGAGVHAAVTPRECNVALLASVTEELRRQHTSATTSFVRGLHSARRVSAFSCLPAPLLRVILGFLSPFVLRARFQKKGDVAVPF